MVQNPINPTNCVACTSVSYPNLNLVVLLSSGVLIHTLSHAKILSLYWYWHLYHVHTPNSYESCHLEQETLSLGVTLYQYMVSRVKHCFLAAMVLGYNGFNPLFHSQQGVCALIVESDAPTIYKLLKVATCECRIKAVKISKGDFILKTQFLTCAWHWQNPVDVAVTKLHSTTVN